ncbi:MAG: hypothetical protein EON55_04210, partial [Alphaproteobacteria bacterium]
MANRNKLDHPILVGVLGIIGFVLPKPKPPANRPDSKPSAGAETRPRQSGVGRDADAPADIPPAGWWAVSKRVAAQVSTDRLMTEAAGVTFYSLLAIFPALAALISLYGLFADPRTVMDHLEAVSGLLPGGGLDILKEQIQSLTSGEPKK